MKVFVLMLCLLSFSVNAKDGKPYIVFDYENNKVLEQKLENKMWSIASLTKLMTAYVFLKKEKNLQSCSMAITNDDDDTLKFTKTRLEKQYDYSCESLSENKAKNLFLQVGDIATLNYK